MYFDIIPGLNRQPILIGEYTQNNREVWWLWLIADSNRGFSEVVPMSGMMVISPTNWRPDAIRNHYICEI